MIETPGITSGGCTTSDDGVDIYPLVISNSTTFTGKFFDAKTDKILYAKKS
jgi:hypothetical protein